MLKYRLSLFLTLICTVFALQAGAQGIQDPTDWKFTVQKMDATHFILTCNATIKAGWHIYGINPGGDGELIGTSFQLDKPNDAASATAKELTPARQETILGEKVNLHSGKATFTIAVVSKKGQAISGTVQYQACNDQMCLPPRNKKFSVKLP